MPRSLLLGQPGNGCLQERGWENKPRENIRTPFVPKTVSSLPLLPKPRAHGTALQNYRALHKWLCSPLPTPPHQSLYHLFGDFPLFVRPTFLHRGHPPGWQDGHCDPSWFKATFVRSNLLLSAAAPLELMSCQSQGHGAQGCGKQNLAQAWREPQLREDRL